MAPEVAPPPESSPTPVGDPLVDALVAGAAAEDAARRGTTTPPSPAVDAGAAEDPDVVRGAETEPRDSDGRPDPMVAADIDPGPDISGDTSGGEATTRSEEPSESEVASLIDYIDSVAVGEAAESVSENKRSLSLIHLLYDR